MSDNVNHPPHYGKGVYEAIKVIEAWGLGFCLGNAAKYICRAGKKHPDRLTDLQKAAWYLQREIEQLTPVGPEVGERPAAEAILNIPAGMNPPPPPPPRPVFFPETISMQDLTRRVERLEKSREAASLVDINQRLEALEAVRTIWASKLPRLANIEQRMEGLEHVEVEQDRRLDEIERTIAPFMKWWKPRSAFLVE